MGIAETGDPLGYLGNAERNAVETYVTRLVEVLGVDLREIWLFGSAVRGDMWPIASPMKSDIDLLVLTSEEIASELRRDLEDETYSLFLQCGRQIAPQFRTLDWRDTPPSGRAQEFRDRILNEGRRLYPVDE